MARMPNVPFLGISDNGLMSTWDIVCVHTIVGYQSGGNAAHFTTGASGKIVQARDTRYRSAANLNGNWRVIAIENEDHGSAYGSWSTNDGHAVPGFTAAQKEAIAKILVWAHQTHGIPLALVPDSKPGRRGVAYHRQGIDGDFSDYAYNGRVSGGEVWSKAVGKVCPGDRRIRQLINEIVPRARALAGGASKEDDMELTDRVDWDRINGLGPDYLGHKILGTWQLAGMARAEAKAARAEIAGLRAAVDKLAGAVAGDDLTATELKSAVKAGVAEALAEGTVNVDIDITGPGGTNV